MPEQRQEVKISFEELTYELWVPVVESRTSDLILVRLHTSSLPAYGPGLQLQYLVEVLS